MRLHRGLGHCGVGSYISQPVCQPGVTSGDEATGTGNVTRAAGARQDPCSVGAFGTGASNASPSLSASGISSGDPATGTLGSSVGTAGIVPSVPEETAENCVGSMLCVAESGQCCFLIMSQRGPEFGPECPPSCDDLVL